MLSQIAAKAVFAAAAALFVVPALAQEQQPAQPSTPSAPAAPRDERPAFIGKETYELTACTKDNHLFKLHFRPYARMYELEKFRKADGEIYLPIDSFIEGFEAVATTTIGNLSADDFKNNQSATLDTFNEAMISYFDAFEKAHGIAILIQPKGRKYWGLSEKRDETCLARKGFQPQNWSI